jgi:hypothetical protein
MVPKFMKSSRKNGTKKRPGRPATGQGIQIGMRWPKDTVAAIDAWAEAHGMSRAESLKRLVELGLKAKGK